MIPHDITPQAIAAFDIGEHVPYLLNQVTIATFSRFEYRLKEHDLALGAWRILAVLHKAGSLRVRELLQRTGIEPPTLSRLLASLEKRGLLARAQSDDDARGVLVQPTPSGLALADDLVPHALRVESELLHGFTADERDFLIRLLKRMQENLFAP
jgi:DNA-binding MarR family transcriptional regulator